MSDKMNVAKIFGENVFNDKVMQERLPKKVYKELSPRYHCDFPQKPAPLFILSAK